MWNLGSAMLKVSTFLAAAVFGWCNVCTIYGRYVRAVIVARTVSPGQVRWGPVWREMPEHTCISVKVGFLMEPE